MIECYRVGCIHHQAPNGPVCYLNECNFKLKNDLVNIKEDPYIINFEKMLREAQVQDDIGISSEQLWNLYESD